MRTVTTLLALFVSAPAMADTYDIDTGHSAVIFGAHHFNAGYTYGRFNEFSGSFNWDKAPEKITAELVIPVASIDSNSEKRDKHLRSPDYFSADEFPEITFKVSGCKGGENKVYQCTGALTLHGVTKDISIDVEHTGEGSDPWGGYRLGLHSTFEVDMSAFGMTPKGLGKQVKMVVSIEGKKK
jgi:polyisoprenoid-binding protein YceI